MKKTLIKNISTLFQVRKNITEPLRGKELGEIPIIKDAWLAIENGIIVEYGNMKDFPGIADWQKLTIIDAQNVNIFPCFADSHTHLVYAGNREQEFEWRLNGLTYQEIAQRGGGIINSAEQLRMASEDELFEIALQRLKLIISMGTGAVEIKSGYGLNTESELKILKVIRRLKNLDLIPIKATFLGAHAIPIEYKQDKQKYIDIVINEMIPRVAQEQLADFIDVFCEDGYFSKEDTEHILEVGLKYNLIAKIHAEQLSHSGGIEAAVKYNALSVDHIEYINDTDVELLKKSKTIPVILPGAAYFLSLSPAPAKKIIENNLPLAIASDFNPGSSPSGNMAMQMSLACVMNKITPIQAFNASTINGAFAMNLQNQCGWIDIGMRANLIFTNKNTTPTTLCYHYAHPWIEKVMINGEFFN